MRSDFENALSTMPITEAQKLFSPGQVRQIVLRDPNGTYAGTDHPQPTCTRSRNTICLTWPGEKSFLGFR